MSPTRRDVQVNGIRLNVVEAGAGPLVILCHGWPELAYSWRHQIPALAAAGYKVVAPDMRGYGRSDSPIEVDSFNIMQLVGDIVGLAAHYGDAHPVVVGHDWGANVAWNCALLRPDLFRAVVAMSVPFRPRGMVAPLQALKAAGVENFYWQYFQTPGVAEAEFEADPAATLRKVLFSGSGDAPPRDGMALSLPSGAGFLARSIDPETLPAWLTTDDIDFMADRFRGSGFRGGLNYYRNIDRNWALTVPWAGAGIAIPALYIAGTRDVVITGFGKAALEAMPASVPKLRDQVLIAGAGHWIQQERPAEVNAAVISFLAGL
ncbi:MAG: alpha/beta hydrolase [Acetobacteraceae bacterium]|nr:alpha/beta hydrolase [Acetobacteraceae bacterium]